MDRVLQGWGCGVISGMDALRPHSRKLAEALAYPGETELVWKGSRITFADDPNFGWFTPANLIEAVGAIGGDIRMRKSPGGSVSVVVTLGEES